MYAQPVMVLGTQSFLAPGGSVHWMVRRLVFRSSSAVGRLSALGIPAASAGADICLFTARRGGVVLSSPLRCRGDMERVSRRCL